MAEQDLPQPKTTVDGPAVAGVRLRNAREALGLSRADIAARTKIAERHLAAIEEERFADLASSTYAVGFSRAYARAVGLDEHEIAHSVRDELDVVEEAEGPPKQTFEPGDPARVPSSRAAWLAGAGALAVLAVVIVFWGNYIFPAASLPDLTSDAPPREAAAPAAPAPLAVAVPQGPVVLTATQPGVWVKITDETGQQLFQKELAQGESYTVPADAAGPQLRTARPEALSITVGGRPAVTLAQKTGTITLPLSGAALLGAAAPQTTALPVRSQVAPTASGQVAQTQTSTPQAAVQPAAARPVQTPSAQAPSAQASSASARASQAPAAPTAAVRTPATQASDRASPTAPAARPSPTGSAAARPTSTATQSPTRATASLVATSAPSPAPAPAAAEAATSAASATRPPPVDEPVASPISP